MNIVLIRHGMTAGNKERRFIGATDEPLTPEAVQLLRGDGALSETARRCGIYVLSPRLRCLQSAAALSGVPLSDNPDTQRHFLQQTGKEIMLDPELAECDFGRFEGKNYLDLTGDPAYQRWIDSGGEDTFPGGENPDAFRQRCCRAYRRVISATRESCQDACFFVHDGTIMSVMSCFAAGREAAAKSYYDWHVDNADGYLLEQVAEDGTTERFSRLG